MELLNVAKNLINTKRYILLLRSARANFYQTGNILTRKNAEKMCTLKLYCILADLSASLA